MTFVLVALIFNHPLIILTLSTIDLLIDMKLSHKEVIKYL